MENKYEHPGQDQLLARYEKHLRAKTDIVDQLEIAGRDLLIRVLDLTLIERELAAEGAMAWDAQAAHQVMHLRNEIRGLANRIQRLFREPLVTGGTSFQPVPSPSQEAMTIQESEFELAPHQQPAQQPASDFSNLRRGSRTMEEKGFFASWWSGRSR